MNHHWSHDLFMKLLGDFFSNLQFLAWGNGYHHAKLYSCYITFFWSYSHTSDFFAGPTMRQNGLTMFSLFSGIVKEG
jgi:hypothetical protein